MRYVNHRTHPKTAAFQYWLRNASNKCFGVLVRGIFWSIIVLGFVWMISKG